MFIVDNGIHKSRRYQHPVAKIVQCVICIPTYRNTNHVAQGDRGRESADNISQTPSEESSTGISYPTEEEQELAGRRSSGIQNPEDGGNRGNKHEYIQNNISV